MSLIAFKGSVQLAMPQPPWSSSLLTAAIPIYNPLSQDKRRLRASGHEGDVIIPTLNDAQNPMI
ncbi:hypothetical protein M378DRAFT_172447 [Amanita muscaria Koide BX008]|uniref:Uncharacterized protein n=1 Tax=Amanita muscaria (strain Koide BX008) TaxID=946122 RepID=A0A0C2WKP6_AMAMK|nr:hypothetical protein M378DRAFT_172447 [Amanita muscaria Koide BX008]